MKTKQKIKNLLTTNFCEKCGGRINRYLPKKKNNICNRCYKLEQIEALKKKGAIWY